VIAVMTILNGLDSTVATAFSSQGSTVFSVAKRPLVITSREDLIKYNKRKDVTKEDADSDPKVVQNMLAVRDGGQRPRNGQIRGQAL
jgi:hypothetical protein